MTDTRNVVDRVNAYLDHYGYGLNTGFYRDVVELVSIAKEAQQAPLEDVLLSDAFVTKLSEALANTTTLSLPAERRLHDD